MIQVEGTLPVAIPVVIEHAATKLRKIVMRQMTAIEYLQAQTGIKEGQFIAIADLSAMTKLVDEVGTVHEMTYEMLGNSSRSNLEYLQGKRAELDAKEAAESSEAEPE
ncbi:MULTISPECIES: hypothetical protein [unclassified Acinetobacter]|uniref:hypothetical protein n=1 Tax=unclassified Acinetobacter TaxID=196816 RepID=UPI00190A5535|nr:MULTISPECIES: hypothetical protein [unclassified Acinetobacter]MBK0063970.1 hypothetical protein [Acinetobacter sp. S55]MBK0067255.1 hypothetical protein [Acinetobacter sp. S54]